MVSVRGTRERTQWLERVAGNTTPHTYARPVARAEYTTGQRDREHLLESAARLTLTPVILPKRGCTA